MGEFKSIYYIDLFTIPELCNMSFYTDCQRGYWI